MRVDSGMDDLSTFSFRKHDHRKLEFDLALKQMHANGMVSALLSKDYLKDHYSCVHRRSPKPSHGKSFTIAAYIGSFAALSYIFCFFVFFLQKEPMLFIPVIIVTEI